MLDIEAKMEELYEKAFKKERFCVCSDILVRLHDIRQSTLVTQDKQISKD